MLFPHEYQKRRIDCGPASIMMIANYYGKYYSLQYLDELCDLTCEGASLLGLIYTCEKIGFKTLASEAGMVVLRDLITLPCIIHWNKSHFVVVYKVTKKQVFVSDPAKGLLKYDFENFQKGWCTRNDKKGVFLAIEPQEYSPKKIKLFINYEIIRRRNTYINS